MNRRYYCRDNARHQCQQHAQAPALDDSIGGKTVYCDSGMVMGEARDHMFASSAANITLRLVIRSQPDDATPSSRWRLQLLGGCAEMET
jgi:hypothetical protein